MHKAGFKLLNFIFIACFSFLFCSPVLGEWVPVDWNATISGISLLDQLCITDKTYAKLGTTYFRVQNNLLQKSTNGGQTWTTTITLDINSQGFRGINVIDSDIYLMQWWFAINGSGGKLIKSIDGGNTWSLVYQTWDNYTNVQGVAQCRGDLYCLEAFRIYNISLHSYVHFYQSNGCFKIVSDSYSLYVLNSDGCFSDQRGIGWINIGKFDNICIFEGELYGFTNSGVLKYIPIANLTINATVGPNGSISPSGMVEVVAGTDQSFTITPNTGCHIVDVLVDGQSVGPLTSYTFTNVSSNRTIQATFICNYIAPILPLLLGD